MLLLEKKLLLYPLIMKWLIRAFVLLIISLEINSPNLPTPQYAVGLILFIVGCNLGVLHSSESFERKWNGYEANVVMCILCCALYRIFFH